MNRVLKIYTPFARAGVQESFTYRINFSAYFLGEILYCFVMYFVWKAVFASSSSSTFMGFSISDMVTFLFISNLTAYLASSNVTKNVGEEIKDGSFSMRMIKPVNYDISFLFNELGQKVMLLSTVFVPVTLGVEIYRYMQSGRVMFSIGCFSLYLFSVVLSYLLSFYLSLCFGFMAFYLKNLWGFVILKDGIINFLSGAIIPLAFMPVGLKNVLSFLPFASLSYTPVMIYMGKYAPLQIIGSILLQLVWIAVFYGLSKLIWKLAIKYVTVQGG